MAAKDHLSDQLIPQKYHDMVWEGSLEPDFDREYTRTTGDPELLPGHWHYFEEGGTTYKRPASSMCTGRHNCPPATQKVRNALAREFFTMDAKRKSTE